LRHLALRQPRRGSAAKSVHLRPKRRALAHSEDKIPLDEDLTHPK
jgi:hypothetical protein